jgi:hypothetical protein
MQLFGIGIGYVPFRFELKLDYDCKWYGLDWFGMKLKLNVDMDLVLIAINLQLELNVNMKLDLNWVWNWIWTGLDFSWS